MRKINQEKQIKEELPQYILQKHLEIAANRDLHRKTHIIQIT